jgi:tetratricopeptide (TPR) repeat protein
VISIHRLLTDPLRISLEISFATFCHPVDKVPAQISAWTNPLGPTMSAVFHGRVEQEVDCGQARDVLERLLADPRFKVPDRQKSILSYLVDRHLEDENVKSYSIAVDVLGRPTSFDPGIDPIVRIEMSRLRSSLESYYLAFGHELDVWISINKGKYVVRFTRKQEAFTQNPGGEDAPRSVAIQQPALTPGRWQGSRVTLFCSSVVMVVAVAAYAYLARATFSEKPTVYVSVEAASPEQAGEASQMRDGLLIALTQFQTLKVAQPAYASARANGSDRRYGVQLKYYGDGDDRSVWWQLVENSSGRLLMSGLERVDTTGKDPARVRDEIVKGLAKRLAANRGVINGMEMQADNSSLGNGCVIRAEYALDVRGDLDAAKDCLQQTLRWRPEDSDANGVLARVLVAPQGRTTAPETVDRALDLAKKAVATAPLSDRAQLGLMAAQAASRRPDAAIEAGNKAIALNPNNPDAAAALGGVLYAEGYRGAGVSMAIEASKDTPVVPRCALVVMALEAFRNARYSEALLWTEQINGSSPLTSVLRAASLGELGSDQAKASLNDGGVSGPVFRKTMDATGLQPELVSMLERGLTKAGADFESVGSISR